MFIVLFVLWGLQSEINRNFKDGQSTISGFLDDYAFVISSFIELYQATFDEKWLMKANELTEYTMNHFYDETSGMFYYTDNQSSKLITRKMEISDNVISSSNSEMAINLFVLGHYFYNEKYIERSKQMLSNVQKEVHANPSFYANWSRLETYIVHPPYEVAIVGKDCVALRHELDQEFNPFILFYGGAASSQLELLDGKLIKGQTTIYVCRNKSCKQPVTSSKEAFLQLK